MYKNLKKINPFKQAGRAAIYDLQTFMSSSQFNIKYPQAIYLSFFFLLLLLIFIYLFIYCIFDSHAIIQFLRRCSGSFHIKLPCISLLPIIFYNQSILLTKVSNVKKV